MDARPALHLADRDPGPAQKLATVAFVISAAGYPITDQIRLGSELT